MRTILLLACVFAVSLASLPPVAAGSIDPRIESLAWLSGNWNRIGLPEGRAGHERWRTEGSALVRTGSMRRNGQTVFEEKLRIEADGDGVYYVADVPGNAAPVRFRMVEQSDGTAVFENPDHDFPSRLPIDAMATASTRRSPAAAATSHSRSSAAPTPLPPTTMTPWSPTCTT